MKWSIVTDLKQCIFESSSNILWSRSINLTGPFLFKSLVVGICHLRPNFNRTFCKQTLETLIKRRINRSEVFAYKPQNASKLLTV